MTSDHYQILELSPEATAAEIKASYRRLAKRFHPDLHGDASGEQMRQLNAAYAILGEPDLRRDYDRLRQPYRITPLRKPAKGNNEQDLLNRWLQEVYQPVKKLVTEVLKPLPKQLEELAYDPYDDTYVNSFQEYLSYGQRSFEQAWRCYTAQPNPAGAARVAEYLYYCLNQLKDGLEELNYFCQNFDDRHLHTGQELLNIADEMVNRAAYAAQRLYEKY